MSSKNTNHINNINNNFGGSFCHSLGGQVAIGVTQSGGLVTVSGSGGPAAYGHNEPRPINLPTPWNDVLYFY